MSISKHQVLYAIAAFNLCAALPQGSSSERATPQSASIPDSFFHFPPPHQHHNGTEPTEPLPGGSLGVDPLAPAPSPPTSDPTSVSQPVAFKPYTVGWNTFAIFTPPISNSNASVGAPEVNEASGCGYIGTYTVGICPQPGLLGEKMGTVKCFEYCYGNRYLWALCAWSDSEHYETGYICQCGSTLPPTATQNIF